MVAGATLALVACVAGLFLYALSPADAKDASPRTFEVVAGQGLRAVADRLAAAHLVRSASAFDAYAFFVGRATMVRPGLYRLAPSMTSAAILSILTNPHANKATVTIPEGDNLFQIDRLLSDALVIKPGALVALQASGTDGNLEGTLFPDTYQFYTDSSATSVVAEMRAGFAAKAAPLFAAAGLGTSTDPASGTAEMRTLILASILEKEVPDLTDQEIVAGILLKRIRAGMPLDVDATVCYGALLAAHGASTSCASLTPLDFKMKSPYNTYLYEGLPPGPIGNPGASAITAALHPQNSPYWYYLSDPATGKTIFAKTLDEQTANRVKYLESH